MWSSITTGFFIALGIVLGFVVFALLLLWGIRRLLGSHLDGEEGFSVELFEQYLDYCLDGELYEEAERVRRIISELQANEKSDLLKDYYVDSEPYMIIESKKEGQDIIRLKENRCIKRK